MERMAVADFKANFSTVIDNVRSGDAIEIVYGRARTPVARLVPVTPTTEGGLLGCLKKARFTLNDDPARTDR